MGQADKAECTDQAVATIEPICYVHTYLYPKGMSIEPCKVFAVDWILVDTREGKVRNDVLCARVAEAFPRCGVMACLLHAGGNHSSMVAHCSDDSQKMKYVQLPECHLCYNVHSSFSRLLTSKSYKG